MATNSKREDLINALLEQINDDLDNMREELCNAHEHDSVIDIAKRMDKIGELKAMLAKYNMSMKGFEYKYSK